MKSHSHFSPCGSRLKCHRNCFQILSYKQTNLFQCRMKRGRVNITSKCQGFASTDGRIKRHKPRPLGLSLSQRLVKDWGNLPHHVVLQIFQYLSLVDRAKASSVCRRWNEVFHIPDLWRRFEFELNQPATSYLKSTHPDLIQQIIKRHAQHLQYVSFKVGKITCPSWNT